jgi:ABC-2 type transport system permease protein
VSLLVVARKDLRLLVRDRTALLSLFALPILVISVVAATHPAEGGGRIAFPIVNEDQGPVANALLKVFRDHLDVHEVSRDDAERMVAVEHRAPAFLVLPAGTSKRYLTERSSTLELATDPAQWVELQAVKTIMLLADREAASLGDPFAEELLHVEERNLTGRRLEFSSLEQNVPGFSVMFVLMNLVFSVAFGLRDEESWGTSRRLAVAPVSRTAVLGGKLLARLVVGSAQLLLLLGFGRVAYGLALGRSAPALIAVIVAIVFAMASFSMLVAALARTREQVIPIGLAAVFVLAALGGCWWPFHSQPEWMQAVARMAVTTWSMFAIHDVMLRDRGLIELLPAIAGLVAYGALSFAVGLRFFRYAET